VYFSITKSTEHNPFAKLIDLIAQSQEIPHVLWNPKVHYRLNKSPPMIPVLGHMNRSRIHPRPRPCVIFRNMILFYGERLLTTYSTSKLEDLTLSAVRDRLLNTSSLHSPNIAPEWLAYMLRIREVPGSNLCPKTGYSDTSN
jgi:hypothetical protein